MYYGDFFTFMRDEGFDKIFVYWVYRKPGAYTPYEQDKKFMDETIYEDSHGETAYIKHVIPLNKDETDFLLGFVHVYEEDSYEIDEDAPVWYHKLSDVKLAWFPKHKPYLEEEESE